MKIGDKRYVFAKRWREGPQIDELTIIAVSPSKRPAFQNKVVGYGAKRKVVPSYTDSDGFESFDECKANKVEEIKARIADFEERLESQREFLAQIEAIAAPTTAEAVAV